MLGSEGERKEGGVTMTARLEQAFAEASKLTPTEQDAVANWLLAALESERRWDKLFADSQDMLSKLAAEALTEHRMRNKFSEHIVKKI